jgi:hypothetical protein
LVPTAESVINSFQLIGGKWAAQASLGFRESI